MKLLRCEFFFKLKYRVVILIYCVVFHRALSATVAKKNGITVLGNEITEEKRHFEYLITDILYNTLRPFKCVAIVCDAENCKMFRDTLFGKLGTFITFFMIAVEESEDLLSPNFFTQDVLISAREEDCQTYVILISNGIQMSRLLRYADRYRIINTRANFIFLYDIRLFEKELHYLWGRIINVIFIREYLGVKTTSSGRVIIPWFELSTVPFPSPIRGVFVPRRLDIWRQNKFRTGADLFRDKTSDLRNQTLKVVTFQHMPAASKILMPEFKTMKTVYPVNNGTHGFTGLEIEILSTVSKTMNFWPELYEPENADTEYWGQKHSDGQFSGLFGEIVKSRADVALGDLYYTPYILDLMDLTTPYNTECLTFLTPEALTSNSWKTLILPFKPIMWLGVTIAIIFNTLCFHYLAKFQESVGESTPDSTTDTNTTTLPIEQQQHIKSSKNNKSSTVLVVPMRLGMENADINAKYAALMRQHEAPPPPEGTPEGLWLFRGRVNSALYTYSMLLMVSLPKVPTGWSLRVLTGWYWIYCLLVATGYRASMTAILANPAPRVTIDTMEELVDSKLSCGSWGDINREFFITSLDPASQIIGTKFETVNETDFWIDKVAEGKFAFYENIYYLKHASVKRQLRVQMQLENMTRNGGQKPSPPDAISTRRNLHIMRDCVINMPISIGLQKNSPIKPRVDKYIRRVLEAGLVRKWLDDVMQPVLNSEISTDDGSTVLMNLEKFIGGMVALGIGYIVSTCAVIGEIVYHRYYENKGGLVLRIARKEN